MASTSFAGRYAISIESGPVNFARASVAKNLDQSTIPSPSGQGVAFHAPPVSLVQVKSLSVTIFNRGSARRSATHQPSTPPAAAAEPGSKS